MEKLGFSGLIDQLINLPFRSKSHVMFKSRRQTSSVECTEADAERFFRLFEEGQKETIVHDIVPFVTSWKQVRRVDCVSCSSRCMVVAGDPRGVFYEISQWLVERDLEVDLLDDFEAATMSLLERSTKRDRRWSLVIFDLDFLQRAYSLAEILDDLAQLRKEVLDIPVIIVSRDFKRDEFGLHRLPIADASLSYPVSKERFQQGILAAMQNNNGWKKRRLETSLISCIS